MHYDDACIALDLRQASKFINTEKQGGGTENTEEQGFWRFARCSFKHRVKVTAHLPPPHHAPRAILMAVGEFATLPTSFLPVQTCRQGLATGEVR